MNIYLFRRTHASSDDRMPSWLPSYAYYLSCGFSKGCVLGGGAEKLDSWVGKKSTGGQVLERGRGFVQ